MRSAARSLPAPAAPALPADAPAWSRFLRDMWTDLKGLVRIEVSDRAAPPLVTPPQQYYLRENLRLRLLSARLSLIARNEPAFRADVKAADAWRRGATSPRAASDWYRPRRHASAHPCPSPR